jgi:hypothetical protein
MARRGSTLVVPHPNLIALSNTAPSLNKYPMVKNK